MLGTALDVARVAPQLWIGSAPPPGKHVAQDFDCLALCSSGFQPPPGSYPGVKVLRAPFDDTEDPTSGDLDTAIRAAGWTASKLECGRDCLVTCTAGRNRSGLVCALSLSMAGGVDPARAGELVREARGEVALTNAAFVDFLNAARGEPCELCVHAPVTRWYHADTLCWVADCKACGVPMVVMRRHTTNPSPSERDHMEGLLLKVGRRKNPRGRWALDRRRRSIPRHWHAHLRPVR